MDPLAAVRTAIDLLQVPSRVRGVRAERLPVAVPLLLRIAAGEEDAIQEAIEPTGRSPAFLKEAATFFIEQILLAPDADSYRVLGCNSESDATELRRNMALLLRWLHPDINANADRAVFASRVTGAWENVKTPERREAYDRSRSAVDDGSPINRRRRRSSVTHGASQQQRLPGPGSDHDTTPIRRVLRRWLGH